jgi:energy-coupling factor transport system ATP-binding protein
MDIQISSLTFTYPAGVTAVRDVSLKISSGETVGIVGQNGAGKTTLVKHLNGLLLPTSGKISVGDWDTRDHPVPKLAARVGYVFQNPDDQLFKSTVWNEVIFGPKNLGWEMDRVQDRAREALAAVGFGRDFDRHPYDLSPTERKGVAIASVLAMDTPIVILDEPTTGQDYAGIERIGQIVDQLKKAGKTVITITHDIDFCAEHFERVVVMAQGRALLDGPAREVLSQADILAQSYVEPPQLIRLAARLDLGRPLLTVEEFVAALAGSPDAQ